MLEGAPRAPLRATEAGTRRADVDPGEGGPKVPLQKNFDTDLRLWSRARRGLSSRDVTAPGAPSLARKPPRLPPPERGRTGAPRRQEGAPPPRTRADPCSPRQDSRVQECAVGCRIRDWLGSALMGMRMIDPRRSPRRERISELREGERAKQRPARLLHDARRPRRPDGRRGLRRCRQGRGHEKAPVLAESRDQFRHCGRRRNGSNTRSCGRNGTAPGARSWTHKGPATRMGDGA
jgi:hypothetical protein